ncbi:MAG TPA: phosphatase PAP2 family protein [Flavobacteriaceae bacterium]|nr:phosphatase PAP2 family protein [Flavobacteriaceae bacterium]
MDKKYTINSLKLDSKVSNNFSHVELSVLIFPVFILTLICVYFFFFNKESFIDGYINIQKDLFFYLNEKLFNFPNLQHNLTQLGDVLIFFPLVAVFFIYAPKLWEALLASALISLLVCAVFKKLFAMPRPAAIFNNEDFFIIGQTLKGKSSLPSGHSVSTFIVIAIVLFAFMPKNTIHKMVWSFFILLVGLIIALSRVGVGAHYPLDVLIGSIIGFVIVVIGINVTNKINWLSCIKNLKLFPLFIVLFIIWDILIVIKIANENLPIYYISVAALTITVTLMTRIYVKTKN